MTKPFILRRLKSDKNIIKDLPDKVYNNDDCQMSEEQIFLYEQVSGEVISQFASQGSYGNPKITQTDILTMITQLKQIVDHPSLFLKSNGVKTALKVASL